MPKWQAKAFHAQASPHVKVWGKITFHAHLQCLSRCVIHFREIEILLAEYVYGNQNNEYALSTGILWTKAIVIARAKNVTLVCSNPSTSS